MVVLTAVNAMWPSLQYGRSYGQQMVFITLASEKQLILNSAFYNHLLKGVVVQVIWDLNFDTSVAVYFMSVFGGDRGLMFILS